MLNLALTTDKLQLVTSATDEFVLARSGVVDVYIDVEIWREA